MFILIVLYKNNCKFICWSNFVTAECGNEEQFDFSKYESVFATIFPYFSLLLAKLNWLTRSRANREYSVFTTHNQFQNFCHPMTISLQIGKALFAFIYVTPTPIYSTARPLIVLQHWFNKGRDLHGNAGSQRFTKNVLPFVLLRKRLLYTDPGGVVRPIAPVTCVIMICMRRMSRKNELLPVITIDFAIFFCSVLERYPSLGFCRWMWAWNIILSALNRSDIWGTYSMAVIYLKQCRLTKNYVFFLF